MDFKQDFLKSLSDYSQTKFKEKKSILSFAEFIALLTENPSNYLRNSAQYFCDMVDYYGKYQKEGQLGKSVRYKLFDADFNKNNYGKIFGHEEVFSELVTNVKNFANSKKIDKLILLHGPNGSAKTSIIQAIANGFEDYSNKDEGAVYGFSWIFPKKNVFSKKTLGFSNDEITEVKDTFAHLESDEIESKITCEQKDHPIFLLSLSDREKLFEIIESKTNKKLNISESLCKGELSYKNKQIFEALISSYQGDLEKVLKHIRVERFYFSRRYRSGLSIVEPQMSVDASLRQITADQSFHHLPPSLGHLSLYEAIGPLVDANRGFIEYSDILKRPVDAWKYLLVASEQGQISLGVLTYYFDTLLFATCNELHLTSFKEYPDWPSYKGRIELIRVPYLLNSHEESQIYLHRLSNSFSSIHIAPHSVKMASRWAVLTRLEAPNEANYPPHLQKLILELSPEEKLELYDNAQVPSRLSQMEARELKKAIPLIMSEWKNKVDYEGKSGASAREINTVLLNAAHDQRFDHLAMIAVFDQIENLILQKTSYDFLKRYPQRNYKDANYLLASVKSYYRSILEEEVRSALGLYSKESYMELFTRYVLHVSAWVKKERFVDPLFKRNIEADESFMEKIEEIFLAKGEAKIDFRNQIINQIAAFNLENPEKSLNYNELFSMHIKKIKEKLYKENAQVVKKIIGDLLLYEKNESAHLDEKELKRALNLKEGLLNLGYNESSAKQAIIFLAFDLDKDQKQPVQNALNL